MAGVLVTGAAGFIGSHLCEALLRGGRKVVGLDNLGEAFGRERKEQNVARLAGQPGFVFVRGDVRDRDCVRQTLGRHGPETVVHLAALGGVRESFRSPDEYADVNVRGLCTLVAECRESLVEHIVFGSSSSVYGDRDDPPFAESDAADRPVSPYAATKRAGELLLNAFHAGFGIPVTSLRFFTVYGPRQRPGMAIGSFVARIIRDEPVTLFGDGSSRRDYTYIDDVVEGTLRALERPGGCLVLNIGSGRPITLLRLVETIAAAVGREARVAWTERATGDVGLTWADPSRAEAVLGFRARVSLEEGIRRTVDATRSDRP
ncbi:MAG: NAD-dependent epimerase/dehydratase family protein [Planctomycetes bacterium]|jgi:UDP-glucuronate 4-epimerase|nr:NAD-dependent epimerase/dehydratase family protein [Planctomycetota bacterium]